MREDRRTGVELDGCTARLVEVHGDRVVHHRTATGSTPGLALKDVLGNGRRAAATVAWTADVEVRNLPLRSVPASAWRAALFEAVEDELFVDEDDVAVAGRVRERPGGTLEALVAMTSSTSVGEVWDLAEAHGAALVPAALCRRGDDGGVRLELSVRDMSADVVVVDDGDVAASRCLPEGALAPLLAALHTDGDAARARLLRVLNGTAQLDPHAVQVVDDHVAALAAAVGEQVRAWRQQGLTTGSVIGLAGPGATIPSLPARLQEVGLRAVSAVVPCGFDVSDVDAWDRFAYAGAISAAGTVVEPGSVVTLANRRVEAARLQRHDRVAALRRRATAAVAVACASGLVLAPPAVAGWREGRAEAARERAVTRFEQVAAVDAAIAHVEQGRSVFSAQASGDIRWAELQRRLEETLPPGATIESERLARAGGTVKVELRAGFPGDAYDAVTAWASRLRAVNQPDPARENAVTIRSFTADPATRLVHASVEVVVPLRAPFVERRDLPGHGDDAGGGS